MEKAKKKKTVKFKGDFIVEEEQIEFKKKRMVVDGIPEFGREKFPTGETGISSRYKWKDYDIVNIDSYKEYDYEVNPEPSEQMENKSYKEILDFDSDLCKNILLMNNTNKCGNNNVSYDNVGDDFQYLIDSYDNNLLTLNGVTYKIENCSKDSITNMNDIIEDIQDFKNIRFNLKKNIDNKIEDSNKQLYFRFKKNIKKNINDSGKEYYSVHAIIGNIREKILSNSNDDKQCIDSNDKIDFLIKEDGNIEKDIEFKSDYKRYLSLLETEHNLEQSNPEIYKKIEYFKQQYIKFKLYANRCDEIIKKTNNKQMTDRVMLNIKAEDVKNAMFDGNYNIKYTVGIRDNYYMNKDNFNKVAEKYKGFMKTYLNNCIDKDKSKKYSEKEKKEMFDLIINDIDNSIKYKQVKGEETKYIIRDNEVGKNNYCSIKL